MTPDHLGLLVLLAEGDQELQVYLEPTDCQAESDLRVQLVLKVFQDFLVLLALMDHQVFLVPSTTSMVTFCVLQSVPLVPRVLLECQDSRVTLGIKEIKESLEKMGKGVMLVHLVLRVFLGLWVCRAHVVSEVYKAQWEL